MSPWNRSRVRPLMRRWSKAGRLLLAGVLAAVVVTAAAGAMTFADPAGDAVVTPEGADMTGITLVDVTNVEITNTSAGLVTFRVTVTTAALSPFSVIAAVLDLDKDPTTGDDGTEAVIGWVVDPLLGSGLEFDRWDGSELEPVDPTTATGTFENGVLTITVPRSELLDTRGFEFGVLGAVFRADFQALSIDVVPDSEEFLEYDLTGLAPPAPPRLAATPVNGKPAQPRAGKRFVVSALVTIANGGLIPTGQASCAVRVGAAPLRTTGRLSNSLARCTMTVPRNATGKVLRGTMTVRYGGATIKRAFSFRVR